MKSNTYETLSQKPYHSQYLLVETTIDHPVAKVWPHALRIGTWMTDHRMVTLDGEAGKVGHFEQVFPRDLSSEVPPPRHHYYGVAEILPLKHIAMEVFPEKGGSYGKTREWIMVDHILLTDLGRSTRLVFLMVDLHLGEGGIDEESARKDQEVARDRLTRFFENLRDLVDRSARQ